MAYNVTQQDLDLLRQHSKQIYIKLELLNQKGQTIDQMQGALLSGDVSIDSESASRRVANATFAVRDETYLVKETSKIWFDKFVRVMFGIKNIRNQQYSWYSFGKFLFHENSYQYDPSTRTLSVNMVDLMETLTGTLNGQLGALTTTIPAGSNIRSSMISTIQQLGWVDKYLIDEIGAEYGINSNISSNQNYNQVPYDLDFSTGTTIYEIVSTLRDLYPGWETYFDTDGIFVCQRVPTGIENPVVLDEFILDNYNLIISESRSNTFSSIKNVTEIWGKCLEVDRYSENCSISGSQYTVSFDDLTALENYTIFGIKINQTNGTNPTIKINTLPPYPIVDTDEKAISAGTFQAGQSYCFKYQNSKFYYLGQWQVHGVAMLYCKQPSDSEKIANQKRFNCDHISYVVNPNTPFGVDSIGSRLQVYSGGEYEEIYSDELATQRAEYENWKTTDLLDTVELEMIAIPWLDVNQKIRYTSNITNQTEEYLTKNISLSLTDGTMSVSLVKFQPLYPFSK